MLTEILDLFFPKHCLICQKNGEFICVDCFKKFKFKKFVCPNCEQENELGQFCLKCKSNYFLDGCWSLGNYKHDCWKKLIQGFKFERLVDLKFVSVDLLANFWEKKVILPSLLKKIGFNNDFVFFSVPFHKKRYLERGFDQLSLIMRVFCQKFTLNYKEKYLIKVNSTRPQVGLNKEERKLNISGAFEINSLIKNNYKNVFIFDDVYTTGATLNEIAFVLKQSGIKRVWGITLAKD